MSSATHWLNPALAPRLQAILEAGLGVLGLELKPPQTGSEGTEVPDVVRRLHSSSSSDDSTVRIDEGALGLRFAGLVWQLRHQVPPTCWGTLGRERRQLALLGARRFGPQNFSPNLGVHAVTAGHLRRGVVGGAAAISRHAAEVQGLDIYI